MSEIIVGLIAVVVGLLLCFRGRGAMRVMLAVWGAFIGFGLGAVLVATLTDQGYLATALGWVAALVLAVAFAALAYAFFAVAVVLGLTSMGFVLGQALATALGASETWLITGVGVLAGLLLGVLAVVTNLPEVLLVLLSALTGASVAIGGLMLLVGTVDLDAGSQVDAAGHSGWHLGQLALAVAGIVVQLVSARRQRLGPVRRGWSSRR